MDAIMMKVVTATWPRDDMTAGALVTRRSH